jgi:NitT/TauT family transport system substrate-binding protein
MGDRCETRSSWRSLIATEESSMPLSPGRLATAAPILALLLLAGACGGGAEEADASTDETATAGRSERIVLGYSAWPGWFPLAITEEAGIFDEVGLDVELRFFVDYLASIDAMAIGSSTVSPRP